MKLKLVLFSLFFALSLTVTAQIPNLSISGFIGTQGVMDTVQADSNILSTFTITNTGTVTFAGEIQILYYLEPDSITVFQLDSIAFDTIGPSQSATYSSNLFANSVTFGGGVNILVIWPSATNATFNTLTDSVYVDDGQTNNLMPDLIARDIQVFPNPAQNQLHFSFGKAAPTPASLTIHDLAGREVYFTEESFQMVNLQSFQAGTYFIRMQFHNGQEYRTRFIKF